jgi:ElaB/YqjD/DUF883 family membrane-anchored ribosome-binding protein
VWHEISLKVTMENNSPITKTREALVKDVEKLKKDAVNVVQDVREHANAHVDETKQRVTDTIQSVQDRLTSHPLTLLGVGLFVGFLFGLKFSR